MTLIEIILLAIALAMDCFTVTIASAMQYPCTNWKHIIRVPLAFGLFQGIMPIIGWIAGIGFKVYIEQFDHWIAFTLLAFLGGKMIWSSLNNDDEAIHHNLFNSWRYLLLMSIATSIDALATGIIFIPFKQQIWLAVCIIAIVSFIFSLIGIFISSRYSKKIHFNFEPLGGIILIGIGIKILIEHCYC